MLVSATVLFVGVAAVATPGDELAALWRPFKVPVERWVRSIEDARTREEFDLAESVLAEAEHVEGSDVPALVRQRGLLLRDRGRHTEAVDLLGRAADLDPTCEARVEQAAALVPLGRWPEAVEVLGRAFEERGASLRADKVLVDPRFAPLVGFGPFAELLGRVRADQSGPLGRLLLKFERIEQAVRSGRSVLDALGSWMAAAGRIAEYAGFSVVLLAGMGLLAAFGVRELGLARAPWSIIVGMLLAAGLWYLGARIATENRTGGAVTIAGALAVVLVPWGAVRGLRFLWRRYVRPAPDPFDAIHLPHTLALMEEVTRLGRLTLAAPPEQARSLAEELDRALELLHVRLTGARVRRRTPGGGG